MDRNREVRRSPMATTNGIPRRRHRPSSLRDSPEDERPSELQETARFRDRPVKKDGDREKKRSERERDRDRFGRSKRRRGDRYVDSSEGSISDEDEEDPDDAPLRVMPPNPASVSSSSSPSSALTSSRKSFPPAAKAFKATPSLKKADEFGFSVPRKARSACTKRFHDCWSSAGVGGESVVLQASPSPVRPCTAAAPVSPTSSNLSMKKKIKANGTKQRLPKSRAKSPSSVQDDIEIEVAEVLYGLMTQSQVPPKQEMISNGAAKHDPREVNRSTVDSKSRATSPISNSGSAPPQNPLAIPQNSPLSAVAPKRKRPRPVGQSEEVLSPTPDKNSASVAGNGGGSLDSVEPHGPHLTMELAMLTPATGVSWSDDKLSSAVDRSQGKNTETSRTVEEVPSPRKESVDVRVNCTAVQPITAATNASETESCREERLEIDLMAPQPQPRSSPERGSEVVRHHEPTAKYGDVEHKSKQSGCVNVGRTDSVDNADMKTEAVDKLLKFSVVGGEEGETQKTNLKKARTSDLHLDLDSSADNSKLNQQPPLETSKDDTITDKTAPASSLPAPISVPAGWPAGLPPMGYVAPLQGVVSIDGRAMAAPTTIQPPHFLFTQPRPGKCATHCYVAKNIHSHQQFMKNYPYWPAPAGAAPLFSGKPYNLNVASGAARGGDVIHVQDKGPTLSSFPGQQPAAFDKVDNAQKKQFYQSFAPPGGPSNIMHGPTPVFFPLGQQQVAAAAGGGGGAASRASSTKPPALTGTATSAGASTSSTMSFNFPNMGANETQYLAILANGAYQFPVPAHVGAAQAYRGPHAQVMPFFNGSYYPSQMLLPSRLQQQQQAAPSQSSSSQKHTQNQPQKPQGSSANTAATSPTSQTYTVPKPHASQTQHPESGREGSQSAADSRQPHPPNMNIYGQNFTLPFNPASFALMNPPASTSTNGNHQAFGMSFAPINGATTPSFDITSMSQNHAFMQSLPEPIRSNYHRMAAQAAQQKKTQEDSRPRASCPPNADDERKRSSGQSIAFSRPDMVESSVPSVFGNNVVATPHQPSSQPSASSPTSNATPSSSQQQQRIMQLQMQQRQLAVAANRNKAPVTSNGASASGSQQQHMMQLQMQQRQHAAATSNGIVNSDHLSSTSAIVAKLPDGKKRFFS